jgi:hypothetical protein
MKHTTSLLQKPTDYCSLLQKLLFAVRTTQNIICGQNAECWYVIAGGTYNNHWALKISDNIGPIYMLVPGMLTLLNISTGRLVISLNREVPGSYLCPETSYPGPDFSCLFSFPPDNCYLKLMHGCILAHSFQFIFH